LLRAPLEEMCGGGRFARGWSVVLPDLQTVYRFKKLQMKRISRRMCCRAAKEAEKTNTVHVQEHNGEQKPLPSLHPHLGWRNGMNSSQFRLTALHNLIKSPDTLISSNYLHLINLFLRILATIITFFFCKEMETHRLVLICKATVGFPPTSPPNKWAPVSMHSS
jgi:hypothetical protein